jgi:type III pantothenate kinase
VFKIENRNHKMPACFLLLDQGNTRIKFRFVQTDGSILEEGSVVNTHQEEIRTWKAYSPERIMMICSGSQDFNPTVYWPESVICMFEPSDAGGIIWAYENVNQMGRDRMAALLGAQSLFPAENLIVADAGTCLTVDYLRSDGVHLGGYISPGFQMRLRAMHAFTASLPMMEKSSPDSTDPGKSTESCMVAGALSGLIAELDLHFQQDNFQMQPPVRGILTGGDAKDLARHLKGSTFVAEDLIFRGLYLACKSRHQ